MKRCIAALGILFFTLLPLSAQELQEITTDGTAQVLNSDKAHARDVAIQDALRNAVEQVTGAVVSSSTLVENAMTVEDNIYSHAKGYVKSYTVLGTTEADNGNTLNVKIKALVRAEALKDDMADIIRGAGNPRMMVLIKERNIGQSEWSGVDVSLGVAENAIIEQMRQKGFEFVDQETAEKGIKRDQAMAAMDGNAKAAAAIGDRAGAEVIVTGNAYAKEAPGVSEMLGGMKSLQATVTVKAFNTDDGKILVSTVQQGKTVHIDEVAGGTVAIQQAAQKAADYMADEIVKRFTRGSNEVTLTVIGNTSDENYTAFVNALKYEVRGIKAVHERDVNDNSAHLEVDTRFNAGQLADELKYKTYDKFAIRVLGRTANKLSIKLIAKR